MTAASNFQRRGYRGARSYQAACDAVPAEPGLLRSAHRTSRQGEVSLRLEPALVLAAVESLYSQELKPFGRILRKRVAELAAADGQASTADVDVDAGRLLEICKASSALEVLKEEGGDWSVLFVDIEGSFVDVYSPFDPYSCELWSQLTLYFDDLEGDDVILPGGRYACALELIRRGLPSFAGRSIGQVCHIVQLAISRKKLLGYLSGSIVPYKRSLSIVKEQCAAWQQPSNQSTPAMACASWESARSGLRSILLSASAGAAAELPLSNVKRLFRSHLQLELSETMLGHSKLSDLLQDKWFADICTVKLERNGYFVIPRASGETQGISASSGPCHKSGLAQPRRIALSTCVRLLPHCDVLATIDGEPLTAHPELSNGDLARTPALLTFSSSPLVLGFCIDDCNRCDEQSRVQQRALPSTSSAALVAGMPKHGRAESGGLSRNATVDTTEGSSDNDSTAGSGGSVSLVSLLPSAANTHRPVGQTLHLAGLL